MKAIIQNAKIERIDKIWKKHKPQGLGFSDTDVVIINLKTYNGKNFTQNFYCRIKADGTIGHSITKSSEKRQTNIQNFIMRCISKDKNYNIVKNISTWKGKGVEVEQINDNYNIKI